MAVLEVVALAAMLWSGYLTTVSFGWAKLGACATGSCSEFVLVSYWSRWLGIPVSLLATIMYASIVVSLACTFSSQAHRRRAAWSLLMMQSVCLIGAAFWFVGLLVLHMHKSCMHCLSLHLMGVGIGCLAINFAPLGQRGGHVLHPRRFAGMIGLGIAAVLLLIGGQLLPLTAMGEPALSQPTTKPPVEEEVAVPADLNTPEGKAALVAHLKQTRGEKWNQPTSPCEFMSYTLAQPGIRRTASGLCYEVLQEGQGPRPTADDHILINYQGKTWKGGVFHDTFAIGQPEEVAVADLIPGVAEAVQMMRAGSRWRLVLKPNLGYGVAGSTGVVPPDQHLVYEVELITIVPSGASQPAKMKESP